MRCLASIFIAGLLGCVRTLPQESTPPNVPQVSAELRPLSSSQGWIAVSARWESESNLVSVNIAGVPADATLDCVLADSTKPLAECRDGLTLSGLSHGEHLLKVLASVRGTLVAYGEGLISVGRISEKVAHFGRGDLDPLAVAISAPQFSNGQALERNSSANFQFSWKNPDARSKLACEATWQCHWGSVTPTTWFDCSKAVFPIPAGVMPLGLQYLMARAQCAEHLGPVASVHWFGVGADYASLQAIARRSQQSVVLSLVRTSDCALSRLSWECQRANSAFVECPNLTRSGEDWVISSPPAGLKARAMCDDQGSSQPARTGPILVL